MKRRVSPAGINAWFGCAAAALVLAVTASPGVFGAERMVLGEDFTHQS